MAADLASFFAQLAGTVVLRPYVIAFLATYLVLATRDMGVRATIGFLGWGFVVAFAAEYASTRVGIPFGLYHYTGETRGAELFASNVPIFDSLSLGWQNWNNPTPIPIEMWIDDVAIDSKPIACPTKP